LKSGGLGWLYVIQKPGGLFWETIDILRDIMKDEAKDLAVTTLELLGYPRNRVFYMLDHVMVPINTQISLDEVEECLLTSGATSIRRLTRGTDADHIEKITQNQPFADIKYGIGEHRYIFSKD